MPGLVDEQFLVFFVDESHGEFDRFKRAVGGISPKSRVVHASDPLSISTMIEHLRPDIVFFDVVMGKVHGDALISDLRDDPAHDTRPMVIWSSSRSASDMRACYKNGASACYAKPQDEAEYQRALEDILSHWLLCAVSNL